MKKFNLLTAAIALALPAVASSHSNTLGSSEQKLSQLENVVNLDLKQIASVNRLDELQTLANVSDKLQLQAINQIKSNHPNAMVRQNQTSGIIEAMYGIAISTSGATAEEAALNFVKSHQALFTGLNVSELKYNKFRSKEALGGNLVRFDQAINGVKIKNAGIGIIMDGDNNVRAVMSDYAPYANIASFGSLDGAAAVAMAQADIEQLQKKRPKGAEEVLQPTFDLFAQKLGVFATPHPEQVIVKSEGEHKLAWQFYFYSTNPFGVFQYVIDAISGEVLSRKDQVKTILPTSTTEATSTITGEDENVIPMTADYFPTFPPITKGMQETCAIEDAEGGETGRPLGMERITLRKFDETNRVTGVEGLLTGKHALIESALVTKGPFPQAALGTYHFSEDNPPLEARPNERDHFTPSPAHHLDNISQFIYITNLLEYLDYLHKDGDAVHSRGVGEGDFPQEYPNESVPLVGITHVPNIYAALDDDPVGAMLDEGLTEIPDYLLSLDNAFAVPLSQEINGEEVVVNPTAYGHGNLFNNLALDFSVPMHEGTHATITPIAGFEGEPEGGALNEGQADLWAYTIGETPDLGTYPVNSCDLRTYLADNGVDPDSFAYIRSAQSQIRYSQLGTRGNAFEVHRDGEIYAGAMWDLRELMTAMYPEEDFKRPDPVTGSATIPTSQGKEAWERIFLGSMYVLGLTAPDTFVKARDAVLIADSVLYPTNPLKLDAPGFHTALIERVFAAREIGINAEAPVGGRQTISTAVSSFTANQTGPATPQNVVADIISEDEVQVSWDPIAGAVGYQLLKRKGQSPARLFAGVPDREYYEGDTQHSGYTHVEFIIGDTQYRDRGQGFGRGPGQGIDALDYQYVVRAIKPNGSGQVGFSNLSGTAVTALNAVDVSGSIRSSIDNVSFENGVFAFDHFIKNVGGTKIYGPIDFNIVNISDSSITVANADNQGLGTPASPANFRYSSALAAGDISNAKYMEFNNPNAQLFTFDAVVSGYQVGTSAPAFGEQAPTDMSGTSDKVQTYHNITEETGVVVIGSTEQTFVNGVDYVDVVFTALPSAIGVTATLSADVDAVAYPDLDFELLDSEGNSMATSGNLGSHEQVGGATQPGENYILRVNGYANGPTTFKIVIDQIVTDPADSSEGSSASSANLQGQTVRFTVNPATGSISPLAILN